MALDFTWKNSTKAHCCVLRFQCMLFQCKRQLVRLRVVLKLVEREPPPCPPSRSWDQPGGLAAFLSVFVSFLCRFFLRFFSTNPLFRFLSLRYSRPQFQQIWAKWVQRLICSWCVLGTKINPELYIHLWDHPPETSIQWWMFDVPNSYHQYRLSLFSCTTSETNALGQCRFQTKPENVIERLHPTFCTCGFSKMPVSLHELCIFRLTQNRHNLCLSTSVIGCLSFFPCSPKRCLRQIHNLRMQPRKDLIPFHPSILPSFHPSILPVFNVTAKTGETTFREVHVVHVNKQSLVPHPLEYSTSWMWLQK